jgi:hypothetical protein
VPGRYGHRFAEWLVQALQGKKHLIDRRVACSRCIEVTRCIGVPPN